MNASNEVFFNVWQFQQWPIATREPVDQYGFKLSDSRCTLKTQRNYVAIDIPEDFHAEALALEYVDVLKMAYHDILQIRYDEFFKITLLHRAVTMKMPSMSEENYYNMNTFGKH